MTKLRYKDLEEDKSYLAQDFNLDKNAEVIEIEIRKIIPGYIKIEYYKSDENPIDSVPSIKWFQKKRLRIGIFWLNYKR